MNSEQSLSDKLRALASRVQVLESEKLELLDSLKMAMSIIKSEATLGNRDKELVAEIMHVVNSTKNG